MQYCEKCHDKQNKLDLIKICIGESKYNEYLKPYLDLENKKKRFGEKLYKEYVDAVVKSND